MQWNVISDIILETTFVSKILAAWSTLVALLESTFANHDLENREKLFRVSKRVHYSDNN